MTSEQMIYADFQRLLNSYPSLFKTLCSVMEQINSLGGIKQAIEEADRRLASVRQDIEKIEVVRKERMAAVDREISAQKADAEQHVVSRKQEADSAANEANLKAKATLDSAEAKAKNIVLKAETAAQEFYGRIGARGGELQKIEAELAQKKTELADLHTQIATVSAEHERVRKMRADLIAKITN